MRQDPVSTTVNLHKNGVVVVQGLLSHIQKSFLRIKDRAQHEKVNLCDSPLDTKEAENQHPPSYPADKQPPEESDWDDPDHTQLSLLHCSFSDMKVKFTQLEIELVQL
ncbi:hypothetical protein DPEC_G00165500 [Dallia pectoralis]|uniref:Uncharacterized protein n=1 Tax=Dallia pectoralis TaxID=75939 RepID=A0ACC2GHP4_DALPE|nr:hypothetical protein DPEC_G00165500 [Dallia pectoralis]